MILHTWKIQVYKYIYIYIYIVVPEVGRYQGPYSRRGVGIAGLALLMMFGSDNPPYKIVKLGGGNSNIFLFSPRKLGNIPILTHIFQMG